tara:strand:+ start:330 stop:506 length:177 start_codon:yes stop_codon:yes gene_type:complete
MFEVTKENFHTFLTSHGMNVEVALWVVEKYQDSDNYRNLLSVRLWVDASKMLLRTVEV